jgi:ubiquinone/menaquinone biosynthesis C-methylase UbiE
MTRFMDRVSMDSGRAWWDAIGASQGDPFALDGYGRVAAVGGETLLRTLVEDIRRNLGVSERTTVLEVGCGAGAITQGLAPGTQHTVGVDFSRRMLAQARRLNLVRTDFVAAEGDRLPIRSGSFDRVLCYSVFNNFPSLAYAQQVIHELVRVTKPGGVVLIGQVPNAARKRDWYRTYAARFGGPRQSALRSWAGRGKQVVTRAVRSALAAAGRRPPPAVEYLYYQPEFFPRAIAGTAHTCEVLPSCDLLAPAGVCQYKDYRLDVRISVAGPAAT